LNGPSAGVFASIYDVITAPLYRLRRRVTRMARIEPGVRAIDIATGTGAQARSFAKAGASVVGIDLSARMLDIARRKARTSAIRFVEADATMLPEPHASFDVACISFALHEMPETIRARVISEIARVTRSGGTIVIVDFMRPRNRVWRFVVEHLIAPVERDSYREFLRSDLRDLLARSGISIVEQRRALLGIARIVVGRSPSITTP
jgi:ubiquinone/menaquinone biosynthesis C-methylase UbiE